MLERIQAFLARLFAPRKPANPSLTFPNRPLMPTKDAVFSEHRTVFTVRKRHHGRPRKSQRKSYR